MTPEHVAASRAAEVRREARAWERAGVIDAPTRAAVDAAYPSDGHAHATAWKVVIFVITTVASLAACAAVAGILRGENAAVWFFFSIVLAAATEALDRSSLRGNGGAAATSFWAVITLSAGFALLLERGHGSNSIEIEIGLFVATIAFALACWRWGFEVYGAFASIAFYLLLAQFPGVRLQWIVVALVLLAGAYRLLDRASLAPEHRNAAAWIFGTSAVALYAAVNLYVLDRRGVEILREYRGSALQPSATAQTAAAFATALLPVVFLFWGIRTRRRLVLDLGAVFAALSLLTLRYYVHLAPLWEILCVAGAALLVLALALNRRLRRSGNGEWGGFTARPLYSGMGALPAAAVVAGFTPDARLTPSPDTSNFTPGGGASGGGGAAGSF